MSSSFGEVRQPHRISGGESPGKERGEGWKAEKFDFRGDRVG